MAGNTQTDDVADRLEKQPPQVGAAAAAAELTSVVSTPSHDADDDGDDREEYLEGGLHAWLTVAGSFLVYFASFGVVNSFGFFQTFYEKSYLTQYSPTAISFIGTLQITLMYLSGPIAGALFDRYGLKWLYPLAALGGAGSLLATSFTRPHGPIWPLFLAQSATFGLTVAYGVQPALAVTGRYFRRRRALAMGVVASGSSVGGVGLPLLLARLVPRVGFAWALRAAALVLLGCYALAMAVSRAPPPPPPPPVVATMLRRRGPVSVGALLDYGGFLDVRYACLSAGAVVASLGVYVPLYYIESYCTVIDPNTKVTSYLLPLINGVSLFGRIIGGHVADKVGRLNVLYPMISLCGMLCLTMWLPSTTPGVLVGFACLYGFASGIFISVMPAATAQITPAEKLGARLGAFGTVTSVTLLTGTPIAGALIESDTRAGYQPLIIFAGSCLLAGGIIVFFARILHDRNLRSKW